MWLFMQINKNIQLIQQHTALETGRSPPILLTLGPYPKKLKGACRWKKASQLQRLRFLAGLKAGAQAGMDFSSVVHGNP